MESWLEDIYERAADHHILTTVSIAIYSDKNISFTLNASHEQSKRSEKSVADHYSLDEKEAASRCCWIGIRSRMDDSSVKSISHVMMHGGSGFPVVPGPSQPPASASTVPHGSTAKECP